MFVRNSIVFTPESKDLIDVEKEIQEKLSHYKHKVMSLSDITFLDSDIHVTTHTLSTSYGDEERLTCIISLYNMRKYSEMTKEELQKELSKNLNELEDLESYLEELEDIAEDNFEEYDIESGDEYKEKLNDLKIDILILKDDIKIIEMC